jgi:hypothetical protein
MQYRLNPLPQADFGLFVQFRLSFKENFSSWGERWIGTAQYHLTPPASNQSLTAAP